MASVKLEIKGARCVVRIGDEELIYGPKPKFDNDEFGIPRVRYIEFELYYWFKLNLFPHEFWSNQPKSL